MQSLPDARLAELARDGDPTAFARLYDRYFDAVYDFAMRLTRSREEALDIAQDTFLKAMNSVRKLQDCGAFRSWLFRIARNTALNRLARESRLRPFSYRGEDGEEIVFDVVDASRLADPADAAQANAEAAIVWEAAASLRPEQLSLLDLHLRQQLDCAEIAQILGVTKNHGYVMLNRLQKALGRAITALVLFQTGRPHCEGLDSALRRHAGPIAWPAARPVVEAHSAGCPDCAGRPAWAAAA